MIHRRSPLVALAALALTACATTPVASPAPKLDGPPFFQRTQRAQMNNVEQGHFFLPALCAHAVFVGPKSAAVAGGAWVALRTAYAMSYRGGYLKPNQLGVFTLPCYSLLSYLSYGPVYAALRRWGGLPHRPCSNGK